MGNLGTPEIIIIALVIVLLFGASRLPATARAVGRSMRIFKSETKGLRDQDEDDGDNLDKPARTKSSQALPASQPGPEVAPPLEETQRNRKAT
jgi:sec-independent protein translocase protein TatA